MRPRLGPIQYMKPTSATKTNANANAVAITSSPAAADTTHAAALIEFAEALRSVAPNLFDAALMHRVQLVGYGFSPVRATEFVEVLSRDVQREVEYPVSTNQAGV
jgi:type IV secretory pathway TrbF-like protein